MQEESVMLGFFRLGTTLTAPFVATNALGAAGDPPVTPNYRVYGQGVLMGNGTGTVPKVDGCAVIGATNALPIVVTSIGHGLQTGTQVTITGVLGNTATNGTWTITRIDADTFSLDGSVGNGNFILTAVQALVFAPLTSPAPTGSWHVTGLHLYSIPLSGGDGYEAGKTYHVLVTYTLDQVTRTREETFTVI